LETAAGFVRRRWRLVLAALCVAAGLAFAVDLSDRQGRYELQYGPPIRMTCEDDPESTLWRGGCERIATDIARTDPPSFLDLYWAFVALYHSPTPREAASSRFAGSPVEDGFDLAAALKGTRYAIAPHDFAGVRNLDHARAVMEEIDKRDRARLLVARGGLSYEALAAGTLANLTDPIAFLAALLLVAILTAGWSRWPRRN
jgi:hypothetical protein